MLLISFSLSIAETTGNIPNETNAVTQGGTSGDNISVSAVNTAADEASYHIFFSRSKHINQLLQAGDVKSASGVWNKQADYFKQSDKDKDKKCTQDLSNALETFLAPITAHAATVLDSVKWPDVTENWGSMKQAIEKADTLIGEVDTHQVLKYTGRRDELISNLLSSRERRIDKVVADAPKNFITFESLPSRNFFSQYPVQIKQSDFLKSNKALWMASIEATTPEHIKLFADCYKEWLSQEDLQDLAEAYFQKSITCDRGRKPTFIQFYDAVRKTKEANLPLRPRRDTNIRIVQLSDIRQQDGSIEFPAEIEIDIPFIGEKAEIDSIFQGVQSTASDALVILDIATTRNERKIQTPENVTSKYQSSTQTVPNQDYPLAEAGLRQAQLNLQSVRQQASYNAATSQGLGCLIVAVANNAAISNANGVVQQAFENLRGTPMTLENPVYTSYDFKKTAVDATKSTSVNYYLIDQTDRSYRRGTFDLRVSRSFNVCYGLRDDDYDKSRHLSRAVKEDEVVNFEQSPVKISLSKIIEKLSSEERKGLPTIVDLRGALLADRNKHIAMIKAKAYTGVVQNDPRFDSVVVILNPNGGMGSGFFVTDDLILTNYHVIKDAKYAEMRLRSGNDTFGKVIAQDIRLDLALIKVQARGVPARLYNSQTLNIGQTVEAIGHPRGLQFSITRGIVSGIREIASKYAREERRYVLFKRILQ